ncbi:hypothetical protein H0H92_003950 [Tricholoma furcatifolium]|nr:hypothetical protein H0H92_003950 [Tricholoma furcatifolium]
MSNAEIPCFPANPDISGIGVRLSIYIQNFLSFVPAFSALLNDGEIGRVTPMGLDGLRMQSVTILITAFAILISAIVQARSTNGITDYDGSIVLNLSWMNNTNLFIYLGPYMHRRFNLPLEDLRDELAQKSLDMRDYIKSGTQMDKPRTWPRRRWVYELQIACKTFVIIIGSLHLSLMAIVMELSGRFWKFLSMLAFCTIIHRRTQSTSRITRTQGLPSTLEEYL